MTDCDPPLVLTTSRLRLPAADADAIIAGMSGRTALAVLLNVRVPDSWPPDALDEQVTELFRDRLAARPDHVGWYEWHIVLSGSTPDPDTLIGSIGFTGPPDEDGQAEIGYSILPEYRRRGFATEAVDALCRWAFARGATGVAAQVENSAASARVLQKNSFVPFGPGRAKGTRLYLRRASD